MVEHENVYHRHIVSSCMQRHDFNVGIRSSSRDVKKIFDRKVPNGQSIATPLFIDIVIKMKV